MTEFESEVHRRVQKEQDAETTRQDQRRQSDHPGQDAVSGLSSRVRAIFEQAESSSTGTLRYERPRAGQKEVHRIRWNGPPPQRSVEIHIDLVHGRAQWMRVKEGEQPSDGTSAFENEDIQQLIFWLINSHS